MSVIAIPKTTEASLAAFSKKSSPSKVPQAQIYIIDKKTQQILPEDESEVYSDLQELAGELPESSPRFIILHYPFSLPDGRLKVSYVLLYWLPENANPTQRMSYAGAVEDLRAVSGVTRVVQVENADDVHDIEKRLIALN